MKDNIKLKGLKGTWYIIEEKDNLCLLESEQLGDEAPWVITDSDYNVILPNVYNGWLDYEEYLSSKYGKDIYKDGRLIFGFVPRGVKHLSAIVNRNCLFVEYGELEDIKSDYLNRVKIDKDNQLVFIDFDELKLTPEYTYLLMKQLSGSSRTNEIIDKYLKTCRENLIEWLKELAKEEDFEDFAFGGNIECEDMNLW